MNIYESIFHQNLDVKNSFGIDTLARVLEIYKRYEYSDDEYRIIEIGECTLILTI